MSLVAMALGVENGAVPSAVGSTTSPVLMGLLVEDGGGAPPGWYAATGATTGATIMIRLILIFNPPLFLYIPSEIRYYFSIKTVPFSDQILKTQKTRKTK